MFCRSSSRTNVCTPLVRSTCSYLNTRPQLVVLLLLSATADFASDCLVLDQDSKSNVKIPLITHECNTGVCIDLWTQKPGSDPGELEALTVPNIISSRQTHNIFPPKTAKDDLTSRRWESHQPNSGSASDTQRLCLHSWTKIQRI